MALATNLTVLSPLLSLYQNKKIIFGVLAAFYVLINATKTHQSDLGEYVFYYLRAKNLHCQNIAENFIWYSFEPLYLFSSYFFSRLGFP